MGLRSKTKYKSKFDEDENERRNNSTFEMHFFKYRINIKRKVRIIKYCLLTKIMVDDWMAKTRKVSTDSV